MCRTTEYLRLLPRCCLPLNGGRTSEARPPGVQWQATPSRPCRPPHHDQPRRSSPTPDADPSPASTNSAFWLRPIRPPLNLAPSVLYSVARDFTPRTCPPGVGSGRPAFSKG